MKIKMFYAAMGRKTVLGGDGFDGGGDFSFSPSSDTAQLRLECRNRKITEKRSQDMLAGVRSLTAQQEVHSQDVLAPASVWQSIKLLTSSDRMEMHELLCSSYPRFINCRTFGLDVSCLNCFDKVSCSWLWVVHDMSWKLFLEIASFK